MGFIDSLKRKQCVQFFLINWNYSYIIHIINICIAVKDQQQPHGNLLLVGKNYNFSRLQHKNNFDACEHNRSLGELNCRALDMLQWDFIMHMNKSITCPTTPFFHSESALQHQISEFLDASLLCTWAYVVQNESDISVVNGGDLFILTALVEMHEFIHLWKTGLETATSQPNACTLCTALTLRVNKQKICNILSLNQYIQHVC